MKRENFGFPFRDVPEICLKASKASEHDVLFLELRELHNFDFCQIDICTSTFRDVENVGG
jgi:hypothetical protein